MENFWYFVACGTGYVTLTMNTRGATVDVAAKWRLNPKQGVLRAPFPFHKMCRRCSKVKFHKNPPRCKFNAAVNVYPWKYRKISGKKPSIVLICAEAHCLKPFKSYLITMINADRYFPVDYINIPINHIIIRLSLRSIWRNCLDRSVMYVHFTNKRNNFITCR